MSSLQDLMRALYPHRAFLENRSNRDVIDWCHENEIYEFDIHDRYISGVRVGCLAWFANEMDWMLAKIRWS